LRDLCNSSPDSPYDYMVDKMKRIILIILLTGLVISLPACSSKAKVKITFIDPLNSNIITTTGPEPPSIPGINASNWKVTEAEAIEIASRHVPAEVVKYAAVSAGISGGGNLNTGEYYEYWEVIFGGINITRDWLNWQPDSQTILSSDGPYNELIARIDYATGKFISREAYYGVSFGLVPPISTTPFVPWSPTSTLSEEGTIFLDGKEYYYKHITGIINATFHDVTFQDYDTGGTVIPGVWFWIVVRFPDGASEQLRYTGILTEKDNTQLTSHVGPRAGVLYSRQDGGMHKIFLLVDTG
jgi:hypothetical protein